MGWARVWAASMKRIFTPVGRGRAQPSSLKHTVSAPFWGYSLHVFRHL